MDIRKAMTPAATAIAFFGPTGGCVNACLAYTLLNGYKAIALARTPAKLTAQLLQQPGLTPETLEQQLRIVPGDVTDVEAVMKTLIVRDSATGPIELVSSVISGIGGTGVMHYTREAPCDRVKMRLPSLPHIEIPDAHITEKSTAAQLEALRRIAHEKFPSYEALCGCCAARDCDFGDGDQEGDQAGCAASI
ncbi:hypothetical protein N7470_006213 [Penicillium chermesinum]|nr:hypothetical protein N7470_006213 [Penicillium chermesinum]